MTGDPAAADATTTHQIVQAGPDDATALAEVIAAAFHDLPPARWLIPDQIARRQIFPGYFALIVEHALRRGLVHTTLDRTAVALWLPSGPGGPPPPGDDYPARLSRLTGRWAPRFIAFDTALDTHHPTGGAHDYLAILAVHPTAQRQGIGTAMLHTRHVALDVAGTPAYLEASSRASRALYLKHGYTDTGLRIQLAAGPALWPMWRNPTGPADE